MKRLGVVITGRGVICSAGNSLQECKDAFKNGSSCLTAVEDKRLTSFFGPHYAGIIHSLPDQNFHSVLTHHIDRYVKLAMIAAREACLDANAGFSKNPYIG